LTTATQQMKLTKHDLKQLDYDYLDSLKVTPDKLLHLTKSLLHDLKAAVDRLNQNSENSSCPPGSDKPWDKMSDNQQSSEDVEVEDSNPQDKNEFHTETPEGAKKSEETQEQSEKPQTLPVTSGKKPGKQPGASGYGRTWKPPVSLMEYHKASHCSGCGAAFGETANFRQYTAYDCVDLILGVPERPGCEVIVTRHALFDAVCPCGHTTREAACRMPVNSLYSGVEVSEWRLIGSTFASFIVHLKMRMRLSLLRIRELILCQLGVPLSKGVLQKCIEESGASAATLEDELAADALGEFLLHADETSWPQGSERLWLWVFTTTLTVCYFIGGRTKAMFHNMLSDKFNGWLMTDGYSAYRDYKKRLRCWAHLSRKGRGLKESTDSNACCFGSSALQLMDTLQLAVYQWRESNKEHQATKELTGRYEEELKDFRRRCEVFSGSNHEKTRKLAVEFLKDWDAIFRVLEHPYLPLTNNDAERALRHWVIARRISYGTRTDTGSRVFALLASVIDTCRKRQADSLKYLAEVINAARTGQTTPPLPQPILEAGV